jgi:uncharacterized protein involved in exopolysaccharide biosynthesis
VNDAVDIREVISEPAPGFGLVEALATLFRRRWWLAGGSLLVGLAALGATFVMKPTFTARTVFLAPQQQQSAAMAALGSLGGLASLAGGSSALRSPADQYVSLLLTRTVSDRIIDRFKLLEAYKAELRFDARKKLLEAVRMSVGKKDGLITIEVDDHERQRAADIANAYVEELRQLTATLAVTEAQQRRAFFERQLSRTQAALTTAQQALEASGFSPGALRAEPKAAAEGYAKLRAEAMAAEVRLQMLRGTLSDSTPEVLRQSAALTALRRQLETLTATASDRDGPDYISKYREYKYQETLFELFSRQYELARVDEAREGALVQVVEVAEPPEKRSKPKRATTAVTATLVAFGLFCALLIGNQYYRDSRQQPDALLRRARWRAALSR